MNLSEVTLKSRRPFLMSGISKELAHLPPMVLKPVSRFVLPKRSLRKWNHGPLHISEVVGTATSRTSPTSQSCITLSLLGRTRALSTWRTRTNTLLSWFGDHMLMPPGKFFTMFHFLEYPFSRGETHIVSPDPYEAPDFDAGFMNDERDMAPMVWGYIKSSKCPLPKFPPRLY